jgi:hypothetical protein
MNFLLIIPMINFMMINGLISYLKIYKRNFNHNNYFGTEYDYELIQNEENEQFQIINEENEQFQIINEENEQFQIINEENKELEYIYINMRKYNLLKRAIFNIKYEQDIIVKELIKLGVDISILDEDDE